MSVGDNVHTYPTTDEHITEGLDCWCSPRSRHRAQPMSVMLEREIAGSGVASCPVCRSALVITLDAIGRTRERCPVCTGVAKPQARNPNDAMVPQTLRRVSVDVQRLPPLAPGQVRCQRCAIGVAKGARYCGPCRKYQLTASARARKGTRMPVHPNPSYRPKPCHGCGETFTPTTANRFYGPCCAEKPEFRPDGKGQRRPRRVRSAP